ncbi:MAG: hypothetical protein ABSD92_05055 [Candidatus Bathyarchaeia archaeon]|jgi:hypothetical protein
MRTICTRITEEEKPQLNKYGTFSHTLREAMKLYLNTKKTEKVLSNLGELQEKNPAKTSTKEIVRLIMEDRRR